MKIKKIRFALVLLTLASLASAIGCELVVDFDRQRIPAEDGGVIPDSAIPDTSIPLIDAGPDARDAGDAETDAGPTDASSDADADV
jgi:hypothetical protein